MNYYNREEAAKTLEHFQKRLAAVEAIPDSKIYPQQRQQLISLYQERIRKWEWILRTLDEFPSLQIKSIKVVEPKTVTSHG